MSKDSKKITLNFGVLAVATLICLCIVCFRIVYAGKTGYIFLVWNLFLAGVPFLFASAAEHFHYKKSAIGFWIFSFLWLIFFPNAPYIVTDFTHLRPLVLSGVPFWFDVVMISSFAITGILFGLCSLKIMGRIMFERLGAFGSWLCVVAVALVSGFGIYLGRYLRWNSWDIFFYPNELFQDITERLAQPTTYQQALFTSLLFAALVLCSYVVFSHFFDYKHSKKIKTQRSELD